MIQLPSTLLSVRHINIQLFPFPHYNALQKRPMYYRQCLVFRFPVEYGTYKEQGPDFSLTIRQKLDEPGLTH